MKSVRLHWKNSQWLLTLPGSMHKHIVFFFPLVWSYLLWQTNPGDHPSSDNLGNECIGKRGRQRKNEMELNCVSYSFVNVLFVSALLQIKTQWWMSWKSSHRKYLKFNMYSLYFVQSTCAKKKKWQEKGWQIHNLKCHPNNGRSELKSENYYIFQFIF
jgi:hypothetical protein